MKFVIIILMYIGGPGQNFYLKAQTAQLDSIPNKPSLKDTNKDSNQESTLDSLRLLLLRLEREAGDLEEEISVDRKELREQLSSIPKLFPTNPLIDKIYFRLGEIYYEDAKEKFDHGMDQYDKELVLFEQKKIKVPPPEPKYDFSAVLKTYRTLLYKFPRSDVADDAVYYIAKCFQQADLRDSANLYFEELVANFPESDFQAESYMQIGTYYFDNPNLKNGKGYDWSIKAFKKVLSFRNDYFTEALYRLGWCYYMQDNFMDAINVFKYLVEEVNLDFSEILKSRQETQNPLLRDEAVDYIAISFSESGGLVAANKFLKLIGNSSYSVKVLKRLGEIYQEQGDVNEANQIFKMIETHYPLDLTTPFAKMVLINNYMELKNFQKAAEEKEDFFYRYHKGTEWSKKNKGKKELEEVDRLAIKCVLSSNEFFYKEAVQKIDKKYFERIIQNYKKLIQTYPLSDGSYEAHWNLAHIYGDYLQKYNQARIAYLTICRKYPQTKYKEESGINAVSAAQKYIEKLKSAVPELTDPRKSNRANTRLILACRNYLHLFPQGREFIPIAMTLGAIFYQHEKFPLARNVYRLVINKNMKGAPYFQSLEYIAQSYLREKDYPRAEKAYLYLYSVLENIEEKKKVKARIVESTYLYANQFRELGRFQEAANELLKILKKYPNSGKDDLYVFYAAEAYEEGSLFLQAAETYKTVHKKFPQSKYADGALFNAALVYEKASQFALAAETYEELIRLYERSPKRKDAMLNVGICYEKNKDVEKMAAAYERYAENFSHEQNAAGLLYYAGKVFMDHKLWDRALGLFKKLVTLYPGRVEGVEVRFLRGRIYFDRNDIQKASAEFSVAIHENDALKSANKRPNDYYAAEAQFHLATIDFNEYKKIEFVLPKKKMQAAQELKAELLKKVTGGYEKTIQYKTPRLFEATFQMALSYEAYANAWEQQELESGLPLIKKMVLQKQIFEASSKLLEKAVLPFNSILKLTQQVDSADFTVEGRDVVEKTKDKIGEILFRIANCYLISSALLQKAPLPAAIQNNMIQYYLYYVKVFDSIIPNLTIAIDQFSKGLKNLEEFKIEDHWKIKMIEYLSKTCYMMGYLYDHLSQEMAQKQKNLPLKLDSEQREEIEFQLEDLSFETQDKALKYYKLGADFLIKKHINNTWSDKIMKRLAKLDPETYALKENIIDTIIVSDSTWLCKTMSDSNWNKLPWPLSSRYLARIINVLSKEGETIPAQIIWTNSNDTLVFFQKYIVLPLQPLKGSLEILADDYYELFINKTYLASGESSSPVNWEKVDRYEIGEYLNGGKNLIAVKVRNPDRQNGGLLTKIIINLDKQSTIPVEKMASLPMDIIDDSVLAQSLLDPSKKNVSHWPRWKVLGTIKKNGEKVKQIEKESLIIQDDLKKLRLKYKVLETQELSLKEEIKRNKEILENKTRKK